MNHINLILSNKSQQDKRSSLDFVPNLLSNILEVPEKTLHIEKDSKGNPFFTHPKNANKSISISHTSTYLAVSLQETAHPIGVDIERTDRKVPKRLIEYYFHPDEVKWLTEKLEYETDALIIWTLKEAYAKALGTGINRDILKCSFLPLIFDLESNKQSSRPFLGYHFRSLKRLKYPLFVSICAEFGPFDVNVIYQD